MSFRNSVAVAALVLGLTAAGDANAAGATCRNMHTGAVDRICRWQVGKGDYVNVYYGTPSAPAPPEPIRYQDNPAPPPVYYAEPAYFDYGYGLPFVAGAGTARVRDRNHGSRPVPVGRPPGFHGGFQGPLESGGFPGHGGGRRP